MDRPTVSSYKVHLMDEGPKTREMIEMDFPNHAYTNPTYDIVNPVEFTYKMSSKETEEFVKLRVSNVDLFSGKRNTAMWAWRAILKHMGLEHKMNHTQASKKWESLRKRFRELQKHSDGGKVKETWRYFTLMYDALEGRLEHSAPILDARPRDMKDTVFLPSSKPKRRRVSTVIPSAKTLVADGAEIEVTLNGDVEGEEEIMLEESQEIDRITQELEDQRSMMDSEKYEIEREKELMARERLGLLRERALLDREMAALERGRASLERERATIEREKAVMEREVAMMEKDRVVVSMDRLALEQEKATLGRLSACKGRPVEFTEDSSSDIADRKERFLCLKNLLKTFEGSV